MRVMPLSRSLLIAGCAIAGSDAAAMPSPVWHGATHFGFDCTIEDARTEEAKRFCESLGPAGTKLLKLPFRSVAGADGVTLRMALRRSGKQMTGTLVAIRSALRGETDEQSPTVKIMLDAAAPGPGFTRALALARNPVMPPTQRRIRSLTKQD